MAHLDGRPSVALDARGHGQSDWDPGEEYGGDQHFADIATALADLEIERCVLVGFSMGAGVAMLTAACLPERVSGLVVIDAYPHAEMTPGSRRIAGWLSTYADNAAAWFDPAIARHFRDQLAAGRDARLDLMPMWEAVECPALIVRGAESDVLPAEVAGEMLTRQPRAHLVNIPGVTHGIPFARPAQLASAIMDFVASLGPVQPATSTPASHHPAERPLPPQWCDDGVEALRQQGG